MALNIKDETVHAQARALAAREGRSVTDIVRRALSEYAANHPDPETVRRRLAAIEAIQAEAARRMTPELLKSSDHDLYGEDGLPA